MEDEFNKELASYMSELKSNAIRLCRNEADAQDLLQDTMQKALRYRDKFEMGTNMRAWLYTIMRNHFINTYRKNKRFNEIVEKQELLVGQENAEGKADTRAASLSEYEYLVGELQGQMGEEFLEVLILVDVFDKRYKEASEILGVPIGTIMSRLYRARKKSRKFLLSNYDPDLLSSAVPKAALQDAIEEVNDSIEEFTA